MSSADSGGHPLSISRHRRQAGSTRINLLECQMECDVGEPLDGRQALVNPSASARPRYVTPLLRNLAAPGPLAAAPRRAPHRHAPDLARLPPCCHPRERAHEGSTKVACITARRHRHRRRPAARRRSAAAATPHGHPHVIVEACSLGRPNVLAQGVRRCRVGNTVVRSAVRPRSGGCGLWVRRP